MKKVIKRMINQVMLKKKVTLMKRVKKIPMNRRKKTLTFDSNFLS